jgi:hypothetical protein
VSSTTVNAVEIHAPYIFWRGGSLLGSNAEFRGLFLANNGGAVTLAKVNDVHIKDVARGISSQSTVSYLDTLGVKFENITDSNIGFTPTAQRAAPTDQQSAIANLAWTYTANDPGTTPNNATTFADGTTLVAATVYEALDEIEAKINAILAVMRTHGLISS